MRSTELADPIRLGEDDPLADRQVPEGLGHIEPAGPRRLFGRGEVGGPPTALARFCRSYALAMPGGPKKNFEPGGSFK